MQDNVLNTLLNQLYKVDNILESKENGGFLTDKSIDIKDQYTN